MTPERWNRIRELLHAASGMDAGGRGEFLRQSCRDDPELQAEVERLLAALAESGNFLEPREAVKDEPGGDRIGPYLIVERAAQGGMGTVYRAVREDDYRQQVALKLVKRDIETDFLLERFRQERQALALLNHPNIARLLDGGSTKDGRPYLVMEWVQGSPITEYCAGRKAPLRDRLQFFQSVCHAVAHAHANLVVHRDLKPSNIFITDDGTPKLLDFGIAKILSPEFDSSGASPTMTGAWALTPDYASPEQVRGEPITTATDIYSLGAVLYELLTGECPHRLGSRTQAEIERVVCAEDVVRPSAGAGAGGVAPREIRGDLDNIILRAMEKAPARRYTHVEELAADVRAYLEGRPVTARPVSFRYRAMKFARRNKTLAGIATAAGLSLTIGLALALWQARVARAEREIAERRFDLARRVAASLLYDVHDQIQDLAGSSRAREFLLRKSLDYLDALSREAGASPELERDLANAYRRAATLQGANGISNLGQKDAARESFRKAVELLNRALAAVPQSVEFRRDLAATHREFIGVTTAGPEMLQHAQTAMSMVETLRRERPGDPALLDDLQKSEFDMGRSLTVLARYPEAIGYYRRAISHGGGSPPQNVALDHRSLGAVLISTGSLSEALAEYQAAAAIDEQRVRDQSADGRAKLDLSYDYADWGLILLRMNQAAAAVGRYREAEGLRAAMAAADPRDARAATSLVSAEWRMGLAMKRAGDRAGAERAFQKAVTEGERMIRTLADPKTGTSALEDACWNIGLCYWKDWGSCAKATPWFLRARQLLQKLNQPTANIDKALAECGSATGSGGPP
ncbi:MAG TPA: serine/threonine-protein kinase [Verrucomicrobiae bacterium]|nr:serine/threonine-protein kinase [Verrucomicrobiae bacterium]